MANSPFGVSLAQDKRIKEANEAILKVVKEYSSKITEVKPADPELKKSYEETMEEFSKKRGGPLFYKYIGSGLGNGALVELMDGSVKYDFISGIGVHYFGHSHPGVIKAQLESAVMGTTMSGNLQQNVDSPKLFKLLVDGANRYGAGFDSVFLTTAGVLAKENALKMAFQKRFPAHRVLAFEKCFAGRTLAVSQITDKAAYRQGLPKTLEVSYVPFYDEKDHEGSIKRAVETLRSHFHRYPGEYAVFCMELVQGEGGYWVGHTEFFKALIDECKKNNVSVIADEVQTFMRTTELFAFQYFGLDKLVDLVTFGKNSQVCGTIFREDHKPKPGLVSGTFTSPTSAIQVGYYLINEVLNDGFLGKDGKIMKLNSYFTNKLKALHEKYKDLIEGPWGLGAMVGMTVFKGDADKSKAFTIKLFENGVLSFMAGGSPTRVRFLLPVGSVTEKDIDGAVSIIEKTLLEMK